MEIETGQECDCCKPPELAEAPAVDDRCHRCGEKGSPVHRRTMESLLKPAALPRLANAPYFFDRTPECDIVYFSNQARSYFRKEELKVRVGLKETEPPVTLCYCFGHTVESARKEIVATGRSTVAARITAGVKASRCSCDVKNPSGRCCLGEVNRAILAIRRITRG